MKRLKVCGGMVATATSLICTMIGPELSFDTSRVKMQLPDGTSTGRVGVGAAEEVGDSGALGIPVVAGPATAQPDASNTSKTSAEKSRMA